MAAGPFGRVNQATTSEINGSIKWVSADVTEDERSELQYYTVRIHVPDEELKALGDLTFVPGMPVEAFIQTGSRTAASYFLKPLTDQLSRAFRGG